MRWYWLSCPGPCQWHADQPVDEDVMKRFVNEVKTCRECAKSGLQVQYRVREVITSTQKGRRYGPRRNQ